MSTIGDPMTSTIPAVGNSGTAYATDVNTFLAEVQTRLETPLAMSSLLATELDMANNPVTNAEYVLLYPNTGTIPTSSLFSSDGNLWWQSSSGPAQLTVGSTLNAAALGGITGDYGGANPAQLRYVDADTIYYFYDSFAGLAWAGIKALTVDIAAGSTSTFRARLAFGGAASYTLTLPAAVPAVTSLVQMSNAGALTASNALATNQSVTVSGTGTYKHADHAFQQSFDGSICTVGSLSTSAASNLILYTLSSGGGTAYIPIKGLKTGDRLKAVVLMGGFVSGTTEPTTSVIKNAAGTPSTVTTTGSGTILAGARTLTVDTPFSVAQGDLFWLKVITGASALNFYTLNVTYDRT